jgi:ribosome assembly protein SQT1
VPSGNTMQVFAGHTSPVQCGEFTPDGKRIVTADEAGTLIFWDPRSPEPVFKLTPTDGRFDLGGITALAVNASSTLAVIGGTSGAVRVVSLSSGKVVGAFGGHADGESVEAVVFVDPTGTGAGAGIAITGATDGKAHIWDMATNRLRATLEHKVCLITSSMIVHFAHHMVLGRCHVPARSSNKRAPCCIGVDRQGPANVGCEDGCPRTGAQGPPRRHPRRCARSRRQRRRQCG